jgi:hypothetical protein
MNYHFTYPLLIDREDRKIMTLGIGVLCNKGETIVLGSEQRASYGATSGIKINPNDEAGKQFRLSPYKLFVSADGTLGICQEVYAQFAYLVENVKNKDDMSVELIGHLFDEARFHKLRQIYDLEIRRKMGITLRQWAQGRSHKKKMNELIVNFGLEILTGTRFPCQFIVAGFIKERGIFLRACEKEHLQEGTSQGIYAIGCGQVDAIKHFNRRGQNVHMSLVRTLLHVYEALYVSQSDYVGPAPDFLIVIWKRNEKLALCPTKLLEGWRKFYAKRKSTASLDDSRVAEKEILNRLRELQEVDE